VRLRFIGDREALEPALRERMREAEQRTAANSSLNFQVAVSYGGRNDVVRAARALAAACQRGELQPADIDEAAVAEHISLARLPEPDLFIRSGGEQRISNFLLWNLAYTELYFTDTLWPDFDEAAFEQALQHFAARQRRYGLTGAQVAAEQAGRH
jgi:undecaprenyl diphosphate synthase